jgi:hypothetical protein
LFHEDQKRRLEEIGKGPRDSELEKMGEDLAGGNKRHIKLQKTFSDAEVQKGRRSRMTSTMEDD